MGRSLHLAEYDFKVRSKKGKANTKADALSRLHTDGDTLTDQNDDSLTFCIGAEFNKDDEFFNLLQEKDGEDDFAKPDKLAVDERIVAIADPNPPTSNFERISL